jgi:putative RNA 2'-phosphotransferase
MVSISWISRMSINQKKLCSYLIRKIIMNKSLKHTSKFISLVLRHQPETIGLKLDENGWADVTALINKMSVAGTVIDIQTLKEIVDTNDKKRFAFNEDMTMIRASQGHSIEVDLDLQPVTPPEILYHGTAEKNIESIFRTGLQKQIRQHVHLSINIETARAVGGRHGKPVVLNINAKAMQQAGFLFYLSENNVWLTNEVPPQYISQ